MQGALRSDGTFTRAKDVHALLEPAYTYDDIIDFFRALERVDLGEYERSSCGEGFRWSPQRWFLGSHKAHTQIMATLLKALSRTGGTS